MRPRQHRCACIWGHVSQRLSPDYKPASFRDRCTFGSPCAGWPICPRGLSTPSRVHVCLCAGSRLGPFVISVCRPAREWRRASVSRREGHVWAEALLNQILLSRFGFSPPQPSPSSSPPTHHLHVVLTFQGGNLCGLLCVVFDSA